MNIVFLSHSAFGGPFAVGSHFLADGLAGLGHTVLHVVTPVSPVHVVRRRPGGNAEVRRAVGSRSRSRHGATQLIPWSALPVGVVPGPVGAVATRRLGRALRREVGGPVDRLVVDQPLFADLVRQLPAEVVVYRPTDRQTSPRLRRAELRLTGAVDRVVTTGREVFDALPGPLRRLPHLELPNGVDTARFTPGPAEGRDGIVYVGALDERLDWNAVRQLAVTRPEVPVDLYGPLDGDPAPDLPASVRLRGPLALDRVPDVLRRARLALMPFNDHPRNLGRSPMKLWEYLATGLHVLASPTPSLARATPAGVHVYPSLAALPDVADTAWTASATPNTAGVGEAQDHSWAGNTRALLEFLR